LQKYIVLVNGYTENAAIEIEASSQFNNFDLRVSVRLAIK